MGRVKQSGRQSCLTRHCSGPGPSTGRRARYHPRCPFRRRPLKASTLVEVIVASVVFLTIFAISLHTLTRLSVNPREGEMFAEVDCLLRSTFREYADGRHDEGKYTREWERGEITVVVAPYRDYGNLQEITVSTVVNRKRIEYKHIIEFANE